MNSYYHAKSCAKKWGGTPEDYIEIHEFIDSSKRIVGDVRHRSMYHHTEGIWLCQKMFGRTITVGGRRAVQTEELSIKILDENPPVTGPSWEIIDNGPIREVPVRLIAELHVMQDLGWIPSPSDYINNMELKQWMGGSTKTERNLSDVFPVSLDPPPAPLIADPNLMTEIIYRGSPYPKKKGKYDDR